MDTILVTAIGTAAATAIVQELKANLNNIRVIGADINEQENIVTSLEVDEFYSFPSIVADQEKYYHFLKQFCIDHQVNFIYCIIDEEVNLLRKKEKDLQSIGVKLCLANKEVVRICHFKNVFSGWVYKNFSELYIEQYDAMSVACAKYPLFIKPIEGRASIGCNKIDSEKELLSFFRDKDWDNFIVQKYINAPIVAVDIVRDSNSGIINIVQRIEHLRNSSGSGIAVEIIDDKHLDSVCRELANRLGLNGVINAEFFRTDDGYKIIEINPRYPAGTKFSCMAGVNVVIDGLKIAKGEAITVEVPEIGSRFARRYDTYRMN